MAFMISSILIKIRMSWFFFLLILVFLGGVIVLIIYINTLSINEKFFIKNFSFIDSVFIFNLTLIFFFFKKNIHIKVNFSGTTPIILYENMNFFVLLFLILYLLLTIICVVKLIKFEYGPLIKRLYLRWQINVLILKIKYKINYFP